MVLADAPGLVAGAVVLGLVHGVEPGHGWPVAATYALDQTNEWLYGFAASFLLGFGHLVSSIAMVGVFFWAKSYFSLTQVNEPLTVLGVQVGGPVDVVAGVLLVALGVREYFHGHSHDHGGDGHHDHSHGDGHTHSHDGHDYADPAEDAATGKFAHAHADAGASGHGHEDGHEDGHGHDHSHDGDGDGGGVLARVKRFVPFVGGHSHDHGSMEEATDRGLWGIAGFAFVLGFAHEEEFEIIAICAGSRYCLELMAIYALTVIFGIVGLTMLLIAGYTRYEERVERYADYLPLFSAVVLVGMGLGFLAGLF